MDENEDADAVELEPEPRRYGLYCGLEACERWRDCPKSTAGASFALHGGQVHGFEWLSCFVGLVVEKQKPINQRTFALFKSLPVEDQQAFAGIWVQVETALRNGLPDLARALVEATAVPQSKYAIKQAILREFDRKE